MRIGYFPYQLIHALEIYTSNIHAFCHQARSQDRKSDQACLVAEPKSLKTRELSMMKKQNVRRQVRPLPRLSHAIYDPGHKLLKHQFVK